MPARPYKRRDKTKAEVGAQIVEHWILARLLNHTFFSLGELNQCIRTLPDGLIHQPFKQLPGNRCQAFEQLGKPTLSPLLRYPYHFVDIKLVNVNLDYHVQHQQLHYSVPYQYMGKTLELHVGEHRVSVYFRQRQVATHARPDPPGIITEPGHMPKRHRKYQQWTPGQLKNWAKSLGPEVLHWVTTQLNPKAHPELAYRLCLGLLNLSREYPAHRLEAACLIANREGLLRLQQITSILRGNRD